MKIEITLNEQTLKAIGYLREPGERDNLTAESVFQTLANDLGMTNSRPGCWEADNMQRVIDGHAWESHLSG